MGLGSKRRGIVGCRGVLGGKGKSLTARSVIPS